MEQSPAVLAGPSKPTGSRCAWHRLLFWLPVPLFLAVTAIIHALQPQFRHESQAVVSTLYTLFCASPSLMVTVLAGQTYLEKGSARMLILGLGAVFFGAIYLTAALLLPDYNAGVTAHNFGFLLSGLCFLLSGLITDRSESRFGIRRLTLSLAYPAAAGAMTLWVWAAYKGLLPAFYVPGVGYTPLRHLVLGMGVATFATSSFWYWRLYLRTGSRFDRWFCQSVALIGVAMVAAILIPAGGTAMAWMARAAQCVGGIYMLVAILSAVQDTGAWRIPLEKALRRHESQYRAVVENVSEGLFVIDGGGDILLANPAMIKMAGWDRPPGGSLGNYSKRIHVRNAQGHDVPLEQWPASRALRGEEVRDEELCIHRLDTGREYTALYSAQPIHNDRGRIERVVITVCDISERKRAEEALRVAEEQTRKIFESITDGFLALDKGWRYTYFNETGARMIGMKREDLIGECVWDLFPHAKSSRFYAAYHGAVETNTPVHFEEFYPEPLNRWLECHCYPSSEGLLVFFRDITDRKKTEEALRESDERLNIAKDAAELGIHDYDVSSGAIRWDKRIREFWGVNPDEPITYDLFISGVHPEDRERIQSAVDKALDPAGEGKFAAEYRVISRSDGMTRWVAATGQVFFENRRAVRLVGTVQEITERKLVEAALRESQTQLKAALSSMTDAVFISDAEGRFIDFNDAFATFHRFRNKDECAKTFAEYPDILDVFMADGELAPIDLWAVPRALRGETVTNAEYTLRRKDTGETWVGSYSFGPIRDKDGAIVGSVVVGRDVTDLKQAEKALHNALDEAEEGRRILEAMMEHIPMGITIADAPEVRIRTVSRYGQELTGKPRQQIEDIPFDQHVERWQIFDADGVTPAKNDALPLTRATQKGELVLQEEWVIGRPDGTRVPILCTAAPIRDPQGNVTGGVIGWQDITERKKAEQALRQWNETLEQKVAERSQLAETRSKQLQALAVELIEAEERERRRIAHLLHEDLQQIIAAARFQLQTVCRGLPDQPILSNVDRLLEDSIGKSRSLSYELSPPALQYSGLISALKGLIQQMSEQFGLQVQLETDSVHRFDNSPLKVFIFRALQELFFNIVKHAGVKSAQVFLAGPDGNLEITVIDQGQGFDPDILDSTGVKAGFGLLTLRERARYIGGDLLIESAPGKGSRFTLTIPYSMVETDGQHLEPAADPQLSIKAERAGYAARGIRVLFADDHKVMRQGLMSMIADQPDIQVVGEAANGREALERARQLKPDVIVMDIAMPEMDGVEATRRIKAELPEVRVIGLSMYEDEMLAQAMHKAGAEAFLNKTASSGELLKAIYGIADNAEK